MDENVYAGKRLHRSDILYVKRFSAATTRL